MDFGSPRLSWCDGRCVQGPGPYSPRHADPRLLAIPASCDNGPILAVDMNSYLLSQMKATAELAKILGNVAAVKKWTKKAEALAENMIRVMYDPEQNMFFDADPVTAERRSLWSASGFLPLWAGVNIDEDKAKEILQMRF